MSLIAKLRALEAAGIAIAFTNPSGAPAVETLFGEAVAAPPADEATDSLDVTSAGIMTPAKAHRLRVLASSGARIIAASGIVYEARGDNDHEPASPEEANIRIMLLDHKRSLKEIQSLEAKIALKRELLPLYTPWVEGVLAGNSGRPDEVLVTAMAWMIDVGDVLEALPLADYVLRHKLDMPAHIARTPATFITEDISEAAIKAYDLGADAGAAFPAGALGALEDLVADEDMPDEVRAKLQKAIGKAILAGGDADDARARQEETLKRYQRALQLSAKAGVKKDIQALEKILKKDAAPPADQTNTPVPSEAG